MEKSMPATQLEKIENRVLRWIRSENQPVSTTQLLAKHGDGLVTAEELRRAVWNLVRLGKAEYTPDRRLVVPE